MSILLIQAPSQPKKTDKDCDRLVGLVRSVRTEIAFLSKEGDKWVEGKRSPLGIVFYDSEGRLNESGMYLEEKGLISKTVYSYDGNGNRIEKRITNLSNGSQETVLFKYIFKYNSNGNRIEEAKYSNDGRPLGKTNYRYDEQNNLLEITEFSSDPLSSKCVIKINNKGQATEQTCYDLKGLPIRKSIYEYELDSAGNWVKRIADFKETREGKPTFFVKTVLYRAITYASSETDFSANNLSLPEHLSPSSPSPMVIRKSSGVLTGSAIKRVEPVYPKEALAAGVKGSVVVEVTVSEKGKVEKAIVISGPNELHETTINAVKQWEFKPTSLSGTPVKVIGRITFNFNR